MALQGGKIAAILAVAIIIIAAVAAVAITNGNNSSDGEKTVTDMRGRTVSLPNSVGKVVCLSAGSLRLVEYMGAVDKVVGIDSKDSEETANYYKATYHIAFNTRGITNVGSADSFKEIMATGADVIITSNTDVGELNKLQDNTNIPVVGINAEGNVTVGGDTFNENIRLLGKVLGKESRAEELINGVSSIVKELTDMKEKSTKTKDTKCYVGGMFYYMKGDLYRTSGNFEPFTLTGVTNVMEVRDGNPYDTEAKEIINAKPDYIFVDSIKISDSKTQYETDLKAYAEVPAVNDGNIYSLYVEKYYGTNWESELMNAYYIGNIIDPSAFDCDAEAKANQILSLFYPGSDITVDDLVEKQGSGAGKLVW